MGEMNRMQNADNTTLWNLAHDNLVSAVADLGFPAELGDAIARHLGSPKAIDRMTAYLHYEKPASDTVIVDEMLAIRAEIDAWREKKESQEANASYNELLWYGLEEEEEP